MATIVLPSVPNPPPPNVARFNQDGTPTTAQVTYETALLAFLRAIKRSLEAA